MMFFGNIVRPYDTSIKKSPWIHTWFVGPEKNIFIQKKYEPIKKLCSYKARIAQGRVSRGFTHIRGHGSFFQNKKKLWNPSKKISNVLLATLFFFFKSPKPHTLKRKKSFRFYEPARYALVILK